MRKQLIIAAAIGSLFSLVSTSALAGLDAAQIARLGKDLTPTGAQKADNASGTIPAWTGGLTKAPAGYVAGKGYVDPFASEKPLYTVTAANMAKYKDELAPGYQAMLKRYADFKMEVYPTHRTAAMPQATYAEIRKQAAKVSLAGDGNGLLNYDNAPIPFPIPDASDSSKAALQVIFNHKTRNRDGGYEYSPVVAVVQSNGSFTPVIHDVKFVMASNVSGAEPNMLFYYLDAVVSPESVAGNVVLVHEPIDQTKQARLAWSYNPGQRRVLRAPDLAYDTPGQSTDGLRTDDSVDMYNGATDRYNWKLLGKKEMLMPYNDYKLASGSLKYSQIMQPKHLNQNLVRYELHRVWVVEATLKPGKRHIYAKRVFYVDEDSWQILEDEMYDGHGKLWRIQEVHPFQHYDVNCFIGLSEVDYDLQTDRYLSYGQQNEEQQAKFGVSASLGDFTPAALRRSGR